MEDNQSVSMIKDRDGLSAHDVQRPAMTSPDAENIILTLYKHVLNRHPGEAELSKWVTLMVNGMSLNQIVTSFYASEEYQRLHRVQCKFPAGHYHSPIVDPLSVRNYVQHDRTRGPDAILGIDFDTNSMRKTWLEQLDFIKSTPFEYDRTPNNRYFYRDSPYPWGDAITLRMMINRLRPRRIIEVGSGFSTACILDAYDHIGVQDFQLTCIEPDPERLRSLLHVSDEDNINIIEDIVQNVSDSIVEALEENDMLFIDSTHVMKTGSDVHFEMFRLLPKLSRGVAVHFHDIGFPFEYPDQWIFDDNFSWNETYVLRAFLMYNSEFKVDFWNSLFARTFTDEIANEMPDFMKNPGGSIWLRRLG